MKARPRSSSARRRFACSGARSTPGPRRQTGGPSRLRRRERRVVFQFGARDALADVPLRVPARRSQVRALSRLLRSLPAAPSSARSMMRSARVGVRTRVEDALDRFMAVVGLLSLRRDAALALRRPGRGEGLEERPHHLHRVEGFGCVVRRVSPSSSSSWRSLRSARARFGDSCSLRALERGACARLQGSAVPRLLFEERLRVAALGVLRAIRLRRGSSRCAGRPRVRPPRA